MRSNRRNTTTLVSLWVVGLVGLSGCAPDGARERASMDPVRAAALEKIHARELAAAAWKKQHGEEYDDLRKRDKAGEKLGPQLEALKATQPRFDDLEDEAWTVVERNPADDAAFAALQVLQRALFTDADQSKLDSPAFQAREARVARVLLDHHLSRADLLDVPYVYLSDRRALIAYWEEVHRGSPYRPVRAEAAYRIARAYLDMSEAVDITPEARSELHQQVRRYARALTEDYPETEPARRVQLLLAALDFPTGVELADVAVAKVAGGTDSLRNYRGKVVLIEFWATWCRPCRRDHPKLVAFRQEQQGRPFEIIGISADETPEKVKQYLASERVLPWPQWYVGPRGALLKEWGVQSYPTYLLLGGDGKLAARGTALSDILGHARKLLARTDGA